MNGENTEQLPEQLATDEGVRERISTRAYAIYLSRGCEPGCELEDWVQAENEILAPSTAEQPPAVEDGETKREVVK